MMKGLYSGVAGLRTHQTRMDVIGNNIANVNTYSFKSQRATFRDVYYQTMRTPGASNVDGTGGTNPSQVGYGSKIGSIDTIHTLSGYAPTDSPNDMYINGEGYFKVESPTGDLYTRLGAMGFDSEGFLVDMNGYKVYGYSIDATGQPNLTDPIPVRIGDGTAGNSINDYKKITINADGSITAIKKEDDAATPDVDESTVIVPVGQISVSYIPNKEALIMEGNSYYSAGNNTGTITDEVPGTNGAGAIITGGLEMSNVDLAKEFTDMITTQRGFQANTKIISVIDEMLQELANLKR